MTHGNDYVVFLNKDYSNNSTLIFHDTVQSLTKYILTNNGELSSMNSSKATRAESDLSLEGKTVEEVLDLIGKNS